MSYLELGGSFELGGYLVAIVTGKRGAAWCAWVEFEQDMEYEERPVHVPVFRHRVPGTYRTKQAAIEAGARYAHQVLTQGTVVVH